MRIFPRMGAPASLPAFSRRRAPAQATGSSRTSLCCACGPGPRKHPRAGAVPPPLAGAAPQGDALLGPQISVARVMPGIPLPSLSQNEAVYLIFLPD